MKSILLIAALLGASPLFAEIKVGAAAPAFSEKDQNGKEHSLSSFKGKWVVLEWYNQDCPYVKKHYGSKNMQTLQSTYTQKGVQWLTVATSAKGKQGYIDPDVALAHFKASGMNSTALLLDADGNMGRAYDAKTTPHMFVINPKGEVVYAGAIDSNDSADPKVIASSINYVAAALDVGMAGKPIEKSATKPYGCSVKY